MDPVVIELIRDRLDRIEAQNTEQLQLLYKHLDEDKVVKETVQRHSIYFSGLSLGLPSAVAFVLTKLGVK